MTARKSTARASDLHFLLQRAQRGDREAFGEVYTRFHPYVLHCFWSLGASYAESWDLTQETFLHALRGIGTLDLGCDVQCGGWLRRIAINVLRRHQARRKDLAWEPWEADAFPEIREAPPFSAVASAEDYGALARCLEALDRTQRRIIGYRYVHGYSGRRVAALLGLAEATLRDRLRQALASLRDCLGASGIIPG